MTKGQLRLLALPVALWAATAGAQSSHFSLGLGYQSVDISGNKNVYYSQLNERSGFVLQNLSFTNTTAPGKKAVVDHLRIDASGFGGSGYGRLYVEAGRVGAYNLKLQYQHAKHFSALPGMANPFLDSGITPGEHTLDRISDSVNLDVELLPGRTITPLVGYRWYRYSGPSTTTYHVGQDEYRLSSKFTETAQDIQAGVAVHLGTFAATILHGRRSFNQSENVTLSPGAGNGNNTRPVLGKDITLDNLTRHTKSDGSYPFTTGYVNGRIGERVRVMGSYVRTDFKGDTTESEDASGSMVSFKLSRFFQGLSGSVRSRASAPDWRGIARVETELVDGLDLSAGYSQRRRNLDGYGVLTSLYTNTVNFSGADPKDVSTLVNIANAVDRQEKQLEAKVSYRKLGPVQLWGSWAKSDETLKVTPDAAEIIVPGGQGGTFDRGVKRIALGANANFSSLKLSLDWRKDDADKAVVRIDFSNQSRTRLQARWSLGKIMNVVGTAEQLTGENHTTSFDFTTKHYALDLGLTPFDKLTVNLGYGVFRSDSATQIRIPHDFGVETSLYKENGKSLDANINLKLSERFHLTGGFSRFDNTGNLGLKLDRTFATIDFDITKTLGATVMYDTRKYHENTLKLANFDAKRYGVFLRITK